MIRRGLDKLAGVLADLVCQVRARDDTMAQQRARSDRVLWNSELLLQRELAAEWEEARATARRVAPESPMVSGYKVYSQGDEDGILADIFRRLRRPASALTCIEIGCGDGRENNTTYLVAQGARAAWCDGSAAKIEAIERALGGLEFSRLLVTQQFVDRDNIRPLVERSITFLNEPEPDLLSMDIDGNDLAVTQVALEACHPKVLCVEYNATFPPPRSVEMAYDSRFIWEEDDYYGASLQAWVDALREYRLVACSLTGVNAFFVRRNLAEAFVEYPAAVLYQPPQHRLIALRGGHAPSLKWVRQQLLTGQTASGGALATT
jgi:hypothetical protein